MFARASGIPVGTIGRYDFKARTYPGAFFNEGAHIFKADFGYTAANVIAGGTCWTQGIFDNTGTRWEPQGRYRNGAVTDPETFYPVINGTRFPFISCSNEGVAGQAASYGYRVHCLSTCGLEGGDPLRGAAGNSATLSINPQLAGSTGAVVYMGASLIFQSEQFAPKISTSAIPPGWIDAQTLTASGTDYGLGTVFVSAAATGWSGATLPAPACLNAGPREGGTPGSANDGDRNNQCNQTETLPFTTTSMPEGSYPVTITARDIVDNTASTSVPIKVDHLPPTLVITGSLRDDAGSYARTGDSVHIVASDPNSGARTLNVTLDGQPVLGSPVTCASDACTTTKDFTLDATGLSDGPHTIVATATDLLGHTTPLTSNNSWTFSVDHVRPDLAPSGVLWDLDQDTAADDDVTVGLDATDGDSIYPSSGIDRIKVLVDNVQKADLPATGCGPANCSESTSWTMHTADYSEGPHTITYLAFDKVGLSDTATETVTIRHIANTPSVSTTPTAAATLRIDGANGGLLGLGGDRLGSASADIGDVNGDGIDDYAVGAPGAGTLLLAGAGAVYVIYGGQSGTINVGSLTASQGFVIQGATLSDAAGTSVAAAGDVDGDGTQDLLIGAPGASLLNSVLQGHAYLIFGGRCLRTIDLANLGTCGFSIAGPTLTLDALLSAIPGFGSNVTGPHSGDGSVSTDINGDGRDDLVLGAADPVLTGHSIRPLEVDDVERYGVRYGRRVGVALRRAGRSPGGRPGGALERASQGGGSPQVAAWRDARCAGPRDRAGRGHDQLVA